MSRFSSTTTLQGYLQLSCLLIIDSDDTIGATSGELSTIGLVVDSEELVQLIVNSMQEFPRGRVPVLQGTVSAHGDQHILGHSRGRQGTPSIVG